MPWRIQILATTNFEFKGLLNPVEVTASISERLYYELLQNIGDKSEDEARVIVEGLYPTLPEQIKNAVEGETKLLVKIAEDKIEPKKKEELMWALAQTTDEIRHMRRFVDDLTSTISDEIYNRRILGKKRTLGFLEHNRRKERKHGFV